MKLLPCELIRDILPLYHDGVCSEVSKRLVNEHLKECKDCRKAMKDLDMEIKIPELEVQAAKPLKSIKRKWDKKARRKGILAGLAVVILAFALWVGLTQNSSIPITAEEYTVGNVCQLSNGMYYMEYYYSYSMNSSGGDICRTADGAIHITQYRPILVKKLGPDSYTIKSYLIDPKNNVLYADNGEKVALTAVYLGCPDKGDAVLLWSADMEVPQARPEIEAKCRDHFVLR